MVSLPPPPKKPRLPHLCQHALLTSASAMSLKRRSEHVSFLHVALSSPGCLARPTGSLMTQSQSSSFNLSPATRLAIQLPSLYRSPLQASACRPQLADAQTPGTWRALFLLPGMPFPSSFPGELTPILQCPHPWAAFLTVPPLPQLGSLLAPPSVLPTISHPFRSRFCHHLPSASPAVSACL